MSKTNWDMAHSFFYADSNERNYPNYMNCGYVGNRFFSYSTVIAMIVKNRKGQKVTLISDNSMSNTTARHISNVWRASPYDLYCVPFEYGGQPQNVYKVASMFNWALARTSELKMTLQNNRLEFCRVFREAERFSKDILELLFLDDYRELYNELKDPEKVKELKAKDRKERLAKLKKVREFLKGKPYLDVVKYAYEYKADKDLDLLKKAREMLNPEENFDFVWRTHNGFYRTSGRVVITKEDGDKALRLWKEGKLNEGYEVGKFTVIKITNDIVQIGCHTIPTKNLEELFKTLKGIK